MVKLKEIGKSFLDAMEFGVIFLGATLSILTLFEIINWTV